MNISYIEGFLAIVEYQSISKASEKLFISQSTLSNRLELLELEIGFPLIERHKGRRYVTLTNKGEEFLFIAKKWKSLHIETDNWKNEEEKQTLKIGSVDSLNQFVFPDLFHSLANNDNNISINVSTHWTTTIFNLLDTYEIDIGLVPKLVKNNNIISEPLFSERMVLISNSLLSNFDDLVDPQSLISNNEIYFDWGPTFRVYYESLWNPLEIPAITVDTPGLIQKFINSKGRWAIVTESVAQVLKRTYPIKVSQLTIPPPSRICYKLKHRIPLTSSLKPINVIENLLSDFIAKNPYLYDV